MISFTDGPAKIETAIASKTAPDVVFDAPGRIVAWGDLGALAPLDDIIAPEMSSIEAGLINGSKGKDGKVYMYPLASAPFVMAFNKEMLEDYGLLNMLPYMTADRTWTMKQYEDLLRALKAKMPRGTTPGVFFAKSSAGDQGTRAFLVNLYGAKLLNDDMTAYVFNDANAVKNLEWVVKAVNEGLLMNGSALNSNDAIDMFANGQAAHTILYSAGLDKTKDGIRNYKGKDFTPIYMPFPNDAGNPVLEYLIAGPCVFNNGDPAKVEAAKKFVQFMATDPEWAPKIVEGTGHFSATNKIVIPITDPEVKYLSTLNKFFGPYYNTLTGFPEMRTYWFPALQSAMNGQPVKAVLDDFVKKSNATLK